MTKPYGWLDRAEPDSDRDFDGDETSRVRIKRYSENTEIHDLKTLLKGSNAECEVLRRKRRMCIQRMAGLAETASRGYSQKQYDEVLDALFLAVRQYEQETGTEITVKDWRVQDEN